MPSPRIELAHGVHVELPVEWAGTSKSRKSSCENEEKRVAGLGEAHVLIHR